MLLFAVNMLNHVKPISWVVREGVAKLERQNTQFKAKTLSREGAASQSMKSRAKSMAVWLSTAPARGNLSILWEVAPACVRGAQA